MLGICLALIDDPKDKEAFEKLVNDYERRLYHEALRILKNPSLAEEALWDSFYNLANNFQKINNMPLYKLEAYMLITIRRGCYRKYNTEKKYYINDPIDLVSEIPDVSDFDCYDKVALTKVIEELDDKYQSVIAYFYYYGFNADETAKLMGISRNSVYNYLKKAGKILKEKLGGNFS